jgi:hypothetical protein
MGVTVLLTTSELQGHYNNAKEMIIERLNSDHNTTIDPNDYIFVTRQKGGFGKLWDKIFGIPEKDKVYIQLLAVKHEYVENVDSDVSHS